MKIIIKPEDVIAKNYLEVYKNEREIIYEQLIKIANNLYIAEKIIDFPFELFTFKGHRDFWNLTSVALFDSTVLAIWTLAVDNKGFSLRRFRNKINGEWKRPDITSSVDEKFRGRLKELNFNKRISEVADKINKVRNHHIAHLDYNAKLGIGAKGDIVQYRISIEDLKSILQVLHELFNTLGFDIHSYLLLWDYVPRRDKNYTTDIDDLLTFVASQSYYLRNAEPFMKENQQEAIGKLSDEQRALVAEWRKKVKTLLRKE